MNCPQCGAPVEAGATKCKYCGEPLAVAQPQQPVYQQPVYQQPMYQPQQQPMGQSMYTQSYAQPLDPGIDPSWPIKSKTAAGVLAIIFGSFGIHKFYLGNVKMGIIYIILFIITSAMSLGFIMTIVGVIEGVMYLVSDDHNFQVKNRVRIR